jgi:hypothetical protein
MKLVTAAGGADEDVGVTGELELHRAAAAANATPNAARMNRRLRIKTPRYRTRDAASTAQACLPPTRPTSFCRSSCLSIFVASWPADRRYVRPCASRCP